ncbi:MAG: hypothetical protein A2V92_02070 [Candidatus Muproteobacteria bacterium RBG_16_65_31]|uniref:Uncharacterized protein n=1 Tax=Candidatus Muproteobacteria bacterium RBG_16_65_31 TaxID=1817759 RepID=A0A1F6TGE0_9PROT|nr:MAG: hypothetical protein A2V92_02070 [Candidatus Muproteobacteria bacterium RBG_16_65_31]
MLPAHSCAAGFIRCAYCSVGFILLCGGFPRSVNRVRGTESPRRSRYFFFLAAFFLAFFFAMMCSF